MTHLRGGNKATKDNYYLANTLKISKIYHILIETMVLRNFIVNAGYVHFRTQDVRKCYK
jgi:hypothetical protein